VRQWSAWSLLVRHYRNTEQQEKASSLLEEMRGRLDDPERTGIPTCSGRRARRSRALSRSKPVTGDAQRMEAFGENNQTEAAPPSLPPLKAKRKRRS